MMQLKTNVGQWKFNWKTVPRGSEGTAEVEIEAGKSIEVRWWKDAHGIWLQLPHGVFGFDLRAENDESGQLNYTISQRMAPLEWSGVSALRGEESSQMGGRSQKATVSKVKAQMPGKIIRVLVKLDQVVQKDQPLIVMEAMKMENEIRAPQAGKITQLKVAEGQAVETGAHLVWIDGQNQ